MTFQNRSTHLALSSKSHELRGPSLQSSLLSDLFLPPSPSSLPSSLSFLSLPFFSSLLAPCLLSLFSFLLCSRPCLFMYPFKLASQGRWEADTPKHDKSCVWEPGWVVHTSSPELDLGPALWRSGLFLCQTRILLISHPFP